MKIYLVEPKFPVPPKSKNHKDFLPVGLLKLGAMYRARGHRVKLIRGELTKKEILKLGGGRWNKPDEIMITSLFTYWKKHVVNCIEHYHTLYPSAKITVGGIYASLMPDDCKKISGVDDVWVGIHPEAEKYEPAYELIEQNPHPLDYQIIHSSRGCPRRCDFCGTWKIEPSFISKSSIKDEILKKKVIFYDNNLLMNPNIDNILDELIELKQSGKIKWCESQSGFDGRILLKKPELANKIKMAGFRSPRIAWDWSFEEANNIKKQIDILLKAGYHREQISVFMIYNWDIEFVEMEKKRAKCFKWGVQIADCRYRPLNRTVDNYDPRAYKKGQTEEDYHIHKEAGWTDSLVRQFRKILGGRIFV
jgi:B12 binding domain.